MACLKASLWRGPLRKSVPSMSKRISFRIRHIIAVMRVIAGELKGQQFQAPHGHKTHPMSDKMRGALFNILGDIEGLTFLDAFAGSGGLSFEAVSRGAASVVALEKEGAAQTTIDRNIKDLHLHKAVHLSRANAAGWSIHNMESEYDILLLDPPYDDLQLNLLQSL